MGSSPSLSLRVPILGTIVTAVGLAATTTGVATNTTAVEPYGLVATMLGVVPLVAVALTRHQRREQIQGEALALALELIRERQLDQKTPTSSNG
jgi:GAF domain-containing protein